MVRKVPQNTFEDHGSAILSEKIAPWGDRHTTEKSHAGYQLEATAFTHVRVRPDYFALAASPLAVSSNGYKEFAAARESFTALALEVADEAGGKSAHPRWPP
jgi:hypothetical protein